MWKYIIIGSVVLLVGTSFLFHKNINAMSGPDGEVAEIQKRFESAVKKSNDIELDLAIKKYAEIRTAYFKQEMEKFAAEKAEWESKDAPLDAEITKAKTDLEKAEKDFASYQAEFNTFKKEAVAAVDESGEEGEDEGVDISDSGDDMSMEEGNDGLAEVGQKIADLVSSNNALDARLAQEQAAVAALGAEIDSTNKAIVDAKQLHADRMARISPADLSCAVLRADTQWDYIVLDAGVNKGIVIGSRLAVHRGDQKICELMVTLVEPDRASCEVIYSTIRPGDAVQAGDRVTSVRNK